MLESLFNKKLAGLKEKILKHSCFPVKFAKILRTPFFTDQLQWLLLKLNILMLQLPIRIGSLDWNESYLVESYLSNR